MNPFEDYVDGSGAIQDGLAAMRAREDRRAANAESYTASMADVRETMQAIENAFKDVVYGYSAILPDGWRAHGDFEKWVARKACAGFVHGGMNPDAELMIGGECDTVRGLEIELDRLYKFLFAE
ncbi:MAG TPA: hypothetical protein VLE70_19450 [Anaerolineae bacterium]|jgi:hypothetical protein|nr:hypothetical protein [Anaerolineae bacterium]